MGAGGYVVLINATDKTWRRTYTHSYQMNSWDNSFPEIIDAGKTTQPLYIEFSNWWLDDTSDDSGEVKYTLEGTDMSFKIGVQGYGEGLSYSLSNFPDVAHSGSIGFQRRTTSDDGTVTFILTGNSELGYMTIGDNDAAAGWMQKFYPLIKDRKLSEISIPGSHDSGMSQTHGGTLAPASSVLTQTKGFYTQLQLGTRFFDVRPVIHAGQFYTGHYGKTIVGWQGANGQSIVELINAVNKFTAAHKELIILNLSHDLDTDDDYKRFTDDQWSRLFKQLNGLQWRFIYKGAATSDGYLGNLTVREFLGGGEDAPSAAAVVVLVEGHTPPAAFAGKGFFLSSAFNIYNRYANTDSFDKMKNDQVNKMEEYSPSRYFLLSWTLTESAGDVFIGPTILDLARTANPRLGLAWQHISTTSFPNIVYIDDVSSALAAAFSMAVNFWFIKNRSPAAAVAERERASGQRALPNATLKPQFPRPTKEFIKGKKQANGLL